MDNQLDVIKNNSKLQFKKFLRVVIIVFCSVVLVLAGFAFIKNKIYPQTSIDNKLNQDLKSRLESIKVIEIDPQFKEVDQILQKLR